MSLTYTIDRIGGTPADVSVEALTQADFVLVRTETVPNGTRSTYAVASGDPSHPTTLVIQSTMNPKGNGGQGVRSATFALNSWSRVASSDASVADVLSPVSAVIAFNLPADIPLEIADVRNLVQNLYALTWSTLTSKVPDNVRLAKVVLYGITQAM